MKFIRKYWLEIVYIYSVVLFVAVYFLFMVNTYAIDVEQSISESVIRFHVLANSDTQEDQLLKQNVRDAVLAYMEPKLKESKSIDESRKIIKAHLKEMTQVAAVVIDNWGKDYAVYTELAKEQFPTKVYGDIALPKGTYEACRIVIGEGKGQNWWCVMYPPLCYVDAATGILPEESKEELKESLTKEEYEVIQFKADEPYKIKFKLLEWLNE